MSLVAGEARSRLSADSLLIGGGLLLAAALAWAKTIHDDSNMSCVMMMPAMHGAWWMGCPLYVGAWATMMAAMMLPATLPVALLIARTGVRQNLGAGAPLSPWLFIAGYLLVWCALGIPAYFATLGAQSLASTHDSIAALAPKLGAATLLLAGIYQLTPWKDACLKHCRTPLHFVMHGWRSGLFGALRMGVEHGAVCAGCCIGLMLVLFALGIMNLMWMAIIAGLMTAEKLLPWGRPLAQTVGAGMALFGLAALLWHPASKLLSGG